MATTLQKKDISYSLSSIVDSAIASAKSEKATKAAKIEADFQKAIADGSMGYQAQLEFRKKQLEDEKTSPIYDEALVTDLETSIGTTKKLIRYEKYRTKYYNNYAEMQAGRLTAQDQLTFIKNQIANETDPDLRAEMSKELVTAEKDVRDYEDSITTNLVTRARNDKTIPTLNEAINRVEGQKATAMLSGNEDAVTVYDTILSSLKSQLNTTTAKDTMNRIEINTTLKGLGAIDKLNSLNNEVNSSDANVPIIIDGTQYSSARDFWTRTRDGYLAGSGSGIFQNFSDPPGRIVSKISLLKYSLNLTPSKITPSISSQRKVLDKSINIFSIIFYNSFNL